MQWRSTPLPLTEWCIATAEFCRAAVGQEQSLGLLVFSFRANRYACCKAARQYYDFRIHQHSLRGARLMTRKSFAIHWAVLAGLVAIHCIGYVSMQASISPLRLAKDSVAEVTLFRIFPAALHLSLEFQKTVGQLRPELGGKEYAISKSEGVMRFKNPGSPLKVMVTSKTGETIFELFPRGRAAFEINHAKAWRELVPFVEDGDIAAFKWPPAYELCPTLPFGFSSIKVTVVETGSGIADEQVSLIIRPPIDWTTKSSAHGYWGFGLVMMFWPFNAILLLLYAGILSWKTWPMRP